MSANEEDTDPCPEEKEILQQVQALQPKVEERLREMPEYTAEQKYVRIRTRAVRGRPFGKRLQLCARRGACDYCTILSAKVIQPAIAQAEHR